MSWLLPQHSWRIFPACTLFLRFGADASSCRTFYRVIFRHVNAQTSALSYLGISRHKLILVSVQREIEGCSGANVGKLHIGLIHFQFTEADWSATEGKEIPSAANIGCT